MNDQRAVLLPLPISNASSILRSMPTAPIITTPTTNQTKDFFNESTSKTLPDEDFFSLLNRLQSRRIDQQRTCLPSVNNSNLPLTSPTSSSTPSKRTRVKQ